MSAPTQTTDGYAFEGGFPTRATVRRAYDAADLNRAVKAYRFFFPTVSGLAIFKGNAAVGVVPNRVFARFAMGKRAAGLLDGLKTWMASHNTAIMAVLCLIVGVKLVGDAIAGFSG
jgi:hypothetical protein